MSLLRSLSCLLVAAYLVSSAAPCAPGTGGGGGAPTGLRAAASDAGEPAQTVRAVCPCGCGKKPMQSGGRLGFALEKAPARAAEPIGRQPLPASTPRMLDAPLRALDPVPI